MTKFRYIVLGFIIGFSISGFRVQADVNPCASPSPTESANLNNQL